MAVCSVSNTLIYGTLRGKAQTLCLLENSKYECIVLFCISWTSIISAVSYIDLSLEYLMMFMLL